ncbi:LCP family protein [Kitasatospora sp. NPDC056327]|uniref:LCP family protein n=1 Tax=Kitasatospora sp. NPDC056327 TaxID=3345785 RepID=UPI0035E3A82F
MSSSSRRRRVVRTVIGLAAVLVLSVAGAGAWFYHRLDTNISTFDAGGVATERPPAPVPTAPGASVPVNVLILGSDTRSDGNSDLGGGEEGVGHSDTAILLHVYADRKHAVGVSIPRDTLVTVPSCRLPNGNWTTPRTNQVFNSAFTVGQAAQGNPACTQNTVEALTGLRIDHTIVVDFKGVAAMTEAINGVDVCVPNDVNSHDIRFKKGRQKISGQPAVDYLRARYGFGDNSDIGRMKRQQAFLSSMIRKIQDQGFSLPTLLPLADAATRSLTVDEGLGTAMKLVDFAQSLQQIKLSDITFVTTPWRYSTVQSGRVDLVHPDVDTLWRLLREDRTLDGQATGEVPDAASGTPAPAPTAATAPPTAPAGTASPAAQVSPASFAAFAGSAASTAPAPSAVPFTPEQLASPVTVVNGVGTDGLAGRGAAAIRAQGFQNVTLGATTGGRLTTEIAYDAPFKAVAEQLTGLFPGARLTEEPGSEGITVTLGRDYRPTAGAQGSPAPGAPFAAPTGPLPTGVPSGIAQNSRTADTDSCDNLTFG